MNILKDNWELIAIGIPAAISILGVLAEMTPWGWDNKAITAIRKIWACIPIGTMDVKKMGRGAP